MKLRVRAGGRAGSGGVRRPRSAGGRPGTGIRGEVREPFLSAIGRSNRSGLPVLAIDVPSGLDCDTGQPLGDAVRARVTVTMAVNKLARLHAPRRRRLHRPGGGGRDQHPARRHRAQDQRRQAEARPDVVYLSGSLFTQAERRWNRQLAQELQGRIEGADVYPPQDFKVGSADNPTTSHTSTPAWTAPREADAAAAVLGRPHVDSGTALELGVAHEIGIPIIGVRTDFRESQDRASNRHSRRLHHLPARDVLRRGPYPTGQGPGRQDRGGAQAQEQHQNEPSRLHIGMD